MATLKCCNCDRQGPPSAFVLLRNRAECPRCRAQAFVVAAAVVGADPNVQAGYENVTAVYQNAALVNGPADVQAAKDDLRPYFAQTAKATDDCGSDAEPLSAYWSALYGEWRAFEAKRPSYFDASSDMHHATRLRMRLRAYQSELLSACPDASVVLVPPPDATLVERLTRSGQDAAASVKDAASSYASTVKVVLVVGGIVAIYAVYKTMKNVQATTKSVLDMPAVQKLAGG